MVRFNTEQAVAIAAIQQLIGEWATELDLNNGLNISGLVTEDCKYTVGTLRDGRAEVAKFYQEWLQRLTGQPGGVPTQRHTLSNLCVTFHGADEASITFSLVYFTTAGMASGLDHADPAAVADVRMNCRQDAADGWLISMFDSNQTFKRTPPKA